MIENPALKSLYELIASKLQVPEPSMSVVTLLREYRDLNEVEHVDKFPAYVRMCLEKNRGLSRAQLFLMWIGISEYARHAFVGIPAAISALEEVGADTDAALINRSLLDEIGDGTIKSHAEMFRASMATLGKLFSIDPRSIDRIRQFLDKGGEEANLMSLASEEKDRDIVGYLEFIPHSLFEWRKSIQKRSQGLAHYSTHIKDICKNGQVDPLVEALLHIARSEALATGDSHIAAQWLVARAYSGSIGRMNLSQKTASLREMLEWGAIHNAELYAKNRGEAKSVEEAHARDIRSVLDRHLKALPSDVIVSTFRAHVEHEKLRTRYWAELVDSMSKASPAYRKLTNSGDFLCPPSQASVVWHAFKRAAPEVVVGILLTPMVPLVYTWSAIRNFRGKQPLVS